jgi:hypothetical protein
MWKYLGLYTLIVIVLCSGLAVAKTNKTSYICFANHSENEGTLGYSKSKQKATDVALKLCLEEYGPPCWLEYCKKR